MILSLKRIDRQTTIIKKYSKILGTPASMLRPEGCEALSFFKAAEMCKHARMPKTQVHMRGFEHQRSLKFYLLPFLNIFLSIDGQLYRFDLQCQFSTVLPPLCLQDKGCSEDSWSAVRRNNACYKMKLTIRKSSQKSRRFCSNTNSSTSNSSRSHVLTMFLSQNYSISTFGCSNVQGLLGMQTAQNWWPGSVAVMRAQKYVQTDAKI